MNRKPVPEMPQAEFELCTSVAELLEFTLATYEGMCDLKKPPQGQLDRHETIVTSTIERSAEALRKLPDTKLDPSYHRVRRILDYIALGDSPKDAAHRFFLVFRHNKLDAHRS